MKKFLKLAFLLFMFCFGRYLAVSETITSIPFIVVGNIIVFFSACFIVMEIYELMEEKL